MLAEDVGRKRWASSTAQMMWLLLSHVLGSFVICVGLFCHMYRKRWASSKAQMMSTSTQALRHTATHCNTLQHTATYCHTLPRTATLCHTTQQAATHCHTLLHNATGCNTPITPMGRVSEQQDKFVTGNLVAYLITAAFIWGNIVVCWCICIHSYIYIYTFIYIYIYILQHTATHCNTLYMASGELSSFELDFFLSF